MGYNIGIRLIEEFLAKSRVDCMSAKRGDVKELADIIAKVGFTMFLGVTATIPTSSWNSEGTAFSLVLEDNPLIEFVELPDEYKGLWYSNLLCGVIRGSLEMIQVKVTCKQTKCPLRGDEATELHVEYKGLIDDEVPVL
eukprot:TRINITY_DN7940_c0_g1_i1.p1 TRINITY_DN7940_c0_g1~~TRINITY_DN7940_c0_g1_i1.p1  ORF type:complete len:139 (+),score=22.33 TRINITY_DN7940_c0_g1_i1:112-528(+)